MGDMSGMSSMMGGGKGASSALSGLGSIGDMSMGMGGAVDPMTAMMMGSDPTGSMDAMAAVTGNYGAGADLSSPAGPQNLGGTQTGTDQSQLTGTGVPAPQQPAAPTAPQAPGGGGAQPAVMTPAATAANWMFGGQGNVPGPTATLPQGASGPIGNPADQANYDIGKQMIESGQGQPTSKWQEQTPSGTAAPTPNQQVASRFGQFAPVSQDRNVPPVPDMNPTGAGFVTPSAGFPPAQGAAPAGGGGGGAAAATEPAVPPQPAPAASDTEATGQGQPAAPQQGQPAAPQGGGFNPMNLIGDIMGLISGNPQSLQKLVGDLMGQFGQNTPLQQMMRQFGGGMGMGRQVPIGPGGQMPPWAPGYNPRTGQWSSPQARQDALNRIRQGGRQFGPRAPQQVPQQTREQAANVPSGDPKAPSRLPNGNMPTGQQAIAPIVSQTLGAAGLPSNAVRGIMFNIGAESSFNPTLRHPDQPRFGGEAHFAHGLYQEGGEEWGHYQRWLNGRDWRDPRLQTQFLAQNLQQRYPRLWNRLQNAQSPEEAAALFARGYLKPARQYLDQRLARIRQGI